MEDEGSPPERKPPRGFASARTEQTRRYSRWVGLAFVGVVAITAVSTLSSQEGDILGTDPTDRGAPLAPFAVPEALGPVAGDANVFQDDCETSRNPCPAGDRRTPACEVGGEDVIRVCDLFDKPLVISFWFTRGGDCLPTQDVVDEVGRSVR